MMNEVDPWWDKMLVAIGIVLSVAIVVVTVVLVVLYQRG